MGIPIDHTVAMTGEITLRGRVLPIGGLREKLLAAHRGQIKKVLIPKENEKDLKDVPAEILRSLEIITVEDVDEVLPQALMTGGEPVFKKRLEGSSLHIKLREDFMGDPTPTTAH